MTRTNPHGLRYELAAIGPDKTRVSLGEKSIIVDLPIDEIGQRWFYWVIRDWKVQDAFPMLSANQREFLMTGITQEEWVKMFKTKR